MGVGCCQFLPFKVQRLSAWAMLHRSTDLLSYLLLPLPGRLLHYSLGCAQVLRAAFQIMLFDSPITIAERSGPWPWMGHVEYDKPCCTSIFIIYLASLGCEPVTSLQRCLAVRAYSVYCDIGYLVYWPSVVMVHGTLSMLVS